MFGLNHKKMNYQCKSEKSRPYRSLLTEKIDKAVIIQIRHQEMVVSIGSALNRQHIIELNHLTEETILLLLIFNNLQWF